MSEKRDKDAEAQNGKSVGGEKMRGGIEDFFRLAQTMREGGWDDTGSRLLRERLARAGGVSAPKKKRR